MRAIPLPFLRRITPLLRRIGCVVSQTTAGAETGRVHRAVGCGGGACSAWLHGCSAVLSPSDLHRESRRRQTLRLRQNEIRRTGERGV